MRKKSLIPAHEPLIMPADPIVVQPGIAYTSEETARILRMEPQTLEVWRTTGRYPGLRWKKPAGRILYMGEDVIEFLNTPHEKAQPYTPKSSRPKLVTVKHGGKRVAK
jgi:hypothetical protein